jgi:hypothetical protein
MEGTMNWYKMKVAEGGKDYYEYVGSSSETPEAIIQKACSGQYIRLDNLLYLDRGEVKDWAEWDKSLVPSIYVNPAAILSFMQFKGDPRSTPRK